MKNLTIVACIAVLSGCATITKDPNQLIKVESYNSNNEKVENAKCTARNERGEWSGTTPGTILVHRSNENLEIKCEKDGLSTGLGTLISRANGSMFGNIIFGGGIGAIIDHSNGKAYSYPDWVRIIMGDNLIFDRKNNKDNELMLGKTGTPEELKKIQTAKEAEEKAAIEAANKKAAETKTSEAK